MNNTDEILRLMKALTELPFETMEVCTQELTVKVSRGGVSLAPAAVKAQAARQDRPGPRREPQESAARRSPSRRRSSACSMPRLRRKKRPS